MVPDQRIKFARHPRGRDAGVGDQTKVLKAAIVDRREEPELARRPELAGHKVELPALVWHQGQKLAPRSFGVTVRPDRYPFHRQGSSSSILVIL